MSEEFRTPDEQPSVLPGAPLVEATAIGSGRRLLCWAGGGTLFLTLFSIGVTLGYNHWNVFHSEWPVWLVCVQGVGLLALWRCFGRPATRRSATGLLMLNGWLLALAGLFGSEAFDHALLFGADLLLRAAILGIWGAALCGAPWIAYRTWRHRSSRRSAGFSVVVWLLLVALLVTVEWCMAKFDRDKDIVAFPEGLLEPPPDELRIAGVGESTMFGTPYSPKFAIPRIVAWQVERMYPECKVVSENIGVPGQSLQQAIACLPRLKYRPHLMLLYSGHNEFFHDIEEMANGNECRFAALDGLFSLSPTFRVLNLSLRTCIPQKPRRVETSHELADGHVFLPTVVNRKRQRFQSRLEQLARFGRSQGIVMLWYVPAALEAGYDPNISFVDVGTSPAEIVRLTQDWNEAVELEMAGDWAAAINLYRAALVRQPHFAEFHFRLGECFLKVGQIDEARRHFQAAIDDDGRPSRQTNLFRKTLIDVAAAFSIPVVATAEALRPHTELGILDQSLFHDYVHPTLRGHFYMGMAAVEVLRKNGTLKPRCGPAADVPDSKFTDAVRDLEIDRSDVAGGLREEAAVLRWHARFRFDPRRRLEQATEYVRLAERLEAGQIEPGEEGTESLE